MDRSGGVGRERGSDDRVARLVEYGKVLEGLARHASVHAAGVVIAPGPLQEYVPVCTQSSRGSGANGDEDTIVTQWDMNALEQAGMLKMDFLGLKTLTVIHDAVKWIERRHGALRHPVSGATYATIMDLTLDDPSQFDGIDDRVRHDRHRRGRAAVESDGGEAVSGDGLAAGEAHLECGRLAEHFERAPRVGVIGARIVDVKLPRSFASMGVLVGRIIAAEGYTFVGSLVDDPDLPVDDDIRPRIQPGRDMPAREYIGYLREREAIKREFADANAFHGYHAAGE